MQHSRRGGFSLVEVLVSLMILGTLLAATMTALDTSFKAYKSTTESASTNVVARMVVSRISSMVRTGTDFGPFPTDVLDATQNPLTSTFMEFRLIDDVTGAAGESIIRLERRDAPVGSAAPYQLWYVENTVVGGTITSTQQRMLLGGVREVNFQLEYDVGPRLKRATVDLTVLPNDFQAARFATQLETPSIRLVTSMAPRRLDFTP
ncbi:MAG TPA: type II secretion system protein [Phycisphaerales bacterium]|nr:type II secretion system protein [Phycisphaerales bacterium]